VIGPAHVALLPSLRGRCAWRFAPNRHAMLGEVTDASFEAPVLPDAVALLADMPEARLARGQVGTVVDLLDPSTVLVEFSDDHGCARVAVPCSSAALLVLDYALDVSTPQTGAGFSGAL